MSSIVINPEIQFRGDRGRFVAACDEAAVDAVSEAGEEGARLARSMAPSSGYDDPRTDSLRSTIKFWQRGMKGNVVATARHAGAIEDGAIPHEIGAPGQKLSNRAKGWFGVGPVQHPGNDPDPYMAPSHAILKEKMLDIFRRHYPS